MRKCSSRARLLYKALKGDFQKEGLLCSFGCSQVVKGCAARYKSTHDLHLILRADSALFTTFVCPRLIFLCKETWRWCCGSADTVCACRWLISRPILSVEDAKILAFQRFLRFSETFRDLQRPPALLLSLVARFPRRGSERSRRSES